MEDNKASVTVVVLNYNSGTFLSECLVALAQQDYRKFSVIVADNNSEDDSFLSAQRALKEVATADRSKFKFVALDRNFGFAAGNNQVVSQIQAPLVALLNPDAIPEPDWLSALVSAATANPNVAMFGSTQLRFSDGAVFDGLGDNYFAAGIPWRGGYGHAYLDLSEDYEVFSPCAAAALYRVDAFRAAGGFDESFFCYVEDVDLGFRLRLAGQKCLQVSKAIVRHVGGASSAGRTFAIFHGTRNLIWTFVKNMPAPYFYLLLPAHIGLLATLTVRALFRGDAKPTIGGIAAAVPGLPRCWADRRRIQSGRVASLSAIARALCWAPWYYLSRSPYRLGRESTSPD